jgi:putative toxin-antitoxin system antitoxin component (TIGR02293 family)
MTAAASSIDLGRRNLDDLISMLKQGLSTDLFSKVATCLRVSERQLADTVDITISTLTRRKRTGRLTAAESERLYRLIRVYNRAVNVLGSEESAQTWIITPIHALGWKSPFEYVDTEIGAREVENILGRLEHGVIS